MVQLELDDRINCIFIVTALKSSKPRIVETQYLQEHLHELNVSGTIRQPLLNAWTLADRMIYIEKYWALCEGAGVCQMNHVSLRSKCNRLFVNIRLHSAYLNTVTLYLG
jgi:hypothetical protein